MNSSYEIIAKNINTTGESPVWCSNENSLYWVDITEQRILRWNETTDVQCWPTQQMAACILPQQNSGLILFEENKISHIQFDQHHLDLKVLHEVEHPYPNLRFNDGCVDRYGRAWIGTMHKSNNGDLIGSLYSLEHHGLKSHLNALATPNGLAFSPEGCTMYLSDSHPNIQKIWAFDYDQEQGVAHNQRLFIDMQQYCGRPDGATVDTDGCYWICAIDSGCILRFSPRGDLLSRYTLPISKPSKCVFGGSDMKTLFVTSICPAQHGQMENTLDGSVFALHTGYQGIAETRVKL